MSCIYLVITSCLCFRCSALPVCLRWLPVPPYVLYLHLIVFLICVYSPSSLCSLPVYRVPLCLNNQRFPSEFLISLCMYDLWLFPTLFLTLFQPVSTPETIACFWLLLLPATFCTSEFRFLKESFKSDLAHPDLESSNLTPVTWHNNKQ